MISRCEKFDTIRCLLLGGVLASAASAAQLSIWVYSADDRPIENVQVVVLPADARATGFEIQRFVTNSQGGVSVTVPDGGQYTVCASSPKDRLLSTCDWDLQQSSVSVASKDSSILKKVTLSRGIPLRIRLNDPGKKVPRGKQREQPPSDDPVLVTFGVWDATGHYHPIPEVSGDDEGTDYELLVPLDADLRLSVQAHGVEILSPVGSPVATESLRAKAVVLAVPRVYEVSSGDSKGKNQ